MPSTAKPLIALPAGLTARRSSPGGYEIKQAYIQAVTRAGGIPVILPASIPAEELPRLAAVFDGFLFSGGADLDPAHYGGELHPNTYGINPERDAFELTVLCLVVDAQKPVFTICRGTQALNVALGGSLIGDIATQQPQALKHDWFPGFRRDKLVHQVQIDPSSRIGAIIGAQNILTNSLHHQAIDRPAPGLRVTARASDGIIEAVEEPTLPFVVGVQWHPECLPEVSSMRALFTAFVASC